MDETPNLNFGAQSSLLASACLNAVNAADLDENTLSDALEMILDCASPASRSDTLKVLRNLAAAYGRLRGNQQMEKAKLRDGISSLYTACGQASTEDEFASWYNAYMCKIAMEFRDAENVEALAYADHLTSMLPHGDPDKSCQRAATPKFVKVFRGKLCSLLRAKLTVPHRRSLLRLACALSDVYWIDALVARKSANSDRNSKANSSRKYEFGDLHLICRLLSIEATLIVDACSRRLESGGQTESGTAASNVEDVDDLVVLLARSYRFFEMLLDFLTDESNERAVELRADDRTLSSLRKVLTETLEMVQQFQGELLQRNEEEQLTRVLKVCNHRLIMRWWTAESDLEPENVSVVNDNAQLLVQIVQYVHRTVKMSASKSQSASHALEPSAILTQANSADLLTLDEQVQVHSLANSLLALLSNAYQNDDLRTTLLKSNAHELLADYFRLCNRSQDGYDWLNDSESCALQPCSESHLLALGAVLNVTLVLCTVALSHLATCRPFLRFLEQLLRYAARTNAASVFQQQPQVREVRMLAMAVAVLCGTNEQLLAELLNDDATLTSSTVAQALLNGIRCTAMQLGSGGEASACESLTLLVSALCTFLETHSTNARGNYAHDVHCKLMLADVDVQCVLHDLSTSALSQRSVTDCETHQHEQVRLLRLRLLATLQHCCKATRLVN